MIEIADLKNKGEIIQTNDGIRVSVCMVTYNQKKYIAQAIESVLMQKTNFKFQLLIGDDASTDGTTEIVREYAEKYPDIIKPIFHKKNIGAGNNSISIYKKVDTEYVAVCDGDDYWIDEYKLQKQVDFLDKNKDYNTVFTKSRCLYEDDWDREEYLPSKEALAGFRERGYLIAKDLIYYNDVTPVALMWRWQLKNGFPKGYSDQLLGDYALNMIHARNSKIAFLPIITAVYRRHCQSIWASVVNSDLRYEKYGNLIINTQKFVMKYYKGLFKHDFMYVIFTTFISMYNIFAKKNNTSMLEKLKNMYPECYLALQYNESIKSIVANQSKNQALKRIKKMHHMLSYMLILQILSIIGVIVWLAAK